MRYRRANAAGGSYFFTVNLANRNNDLLVSHIDKLREVVRTVRWRHHFDIVAMVVLPDHLHAVWRLPPNDAGFPMRWSLIKAGFSRSIPRRERIRKSREKKRERGIWQRRYWEHQIRDEIHLERHVAYSFQSGETRIYVTCGGLAVFLHSQLHQKRMVDRRMGCRWNGRGR